MVSRDHYGPTYNGKTFASQSSKRPVVGWLKVWGKEATVSCCADLM